MIVWCHSFLAEVAIVRGDIAAGEERTQLAGREVSTTERSSAGTT